MYDPLRDQCMISHVMLDGGGVRTGETVWVGEDVRGTSQVWVSEHDPRRVASECGPGVG